MRSYRATIYACYLGYITQAIVNNLVPLLFVTFQGQFDLTLTQLTFLITFNFLTQLGVDLIAARFADRIGIRPCIAAAQLFCALGLAGLGLFPNIFPPFAGLMVSVILYAIGGGIIETLISPIVEACPSDNKESAMSLLHSFYCWGQMGVVLLSTLFFVLVGHQHWPILGILWSFIPLFNFFLFLRVPIAPFVEEGQSPMGIRDLLKTPMFYVLAGLMVCSGASELGMSQWASSFAETGLKVTKTVGDLLGPCLFALFMGLARVFYASQAERISLPTFILASCSLCIVTYLVASLSGNALVSLFACALCGLSVGILWPGVFSLAARACPTGGTAMFALLALAGDLGCSGGPTFVGLMSSLFGGNLKAGLGLGFLFPAAMVALVLAFLRMGKKQSARKQAEL